MEDKVEWHYKFPSDEELNISFRRLQSMRNSLISWLIPNPRLIAVFFF